MRVLSGFVELQMVVCRSLSLPRFTCQFSTSYQPKAKDDKQQAARQHIKPDSIS